MTADSSTAPEKHRLRAQYGRVPIISVPAKLLSAAVERIFRAHWRDRAVNILREREPQFSASQVITPGQVRVFIAILSIVLASLILAPRWAGLTLVVLSGIAFFLNAAFRAVLLWVGADERPIGPAPPPVAERDLPMYSVLVPLYREANVLPALVQALRALEYPGIR